LKDQNANNHKLRKEVEKLKQRADRKAQGEDNKREEIRSLKD
jgi:hypothetical protein